MEKIGFIGLGAMGSRMAQRLINAGYTVCVFNRDQKKIEPFQNTKAKLAHSFEDAALGAQFIFSMLRDDKASEDVWQILLPNLKAGQVVVETSTLSPQWSKELEGRLKKAGVIYLEAPVAGSLPQVEAGKLISFVAGDSSSAKKVTPLLQSYSEEVRYLGEVGKASTMKLLANGFFLSQMASLKELIDTGQKSGLSFDEMHEIFQILPATSLAMNGFLTLAAKNDHAPRFAVSLVEKDLRYLEELAQKSQIPHALISATHKKFLSLIDQGLGDKNASVLLS